MRISSCTVSFLGSLSTLVNTSPLLDKYCANEFNSSLEAHDETTKATFLAFFTKLKNSVFAFSRPICFPFCNEESDLSSFNRKSRPLLQIQGSTTGVTLTTSLFFVEILILHPRAQPGQTDLVFLSCQTLA